MRERAAIDTGTEQGRRSFIRVLNQRLPRKRNIAQGVLRNEDGEILLCELTYKKEWDLPGGVVDPGESPAECVMREVREELGLTVTAGSLLAVNWLPPYRGWDDAMLFLFDLGVAPRATIDSMVLARKELRSVHWAAADVARSKTATYTSRMLEQLGQHTAYLENSERVNT